MGEDEYKQVLWKFIELDTITTTNATQSGLGGSLKSMTLYDELDRWKSLEISLEGEVIPLRKHEDIFINVDLELGKY